MSTAAAGGDDRDSLPILVVGAGLTGSMIALALAQRGFKLVIVEARGDPRAIATPEDSTIDKVVGQLANSAKRSINLALSYRGQCGLKNVGLLDAVMGHVVTMENRAVHVPGKPVSLQPYGTKGQAIYSVSRSLLNCTLLDELTREVAKTHRLDIRFNTKLTRISEDGEVTVVPAAGGSQTFRTRLVIGADGAFSAVRSAMMRLCRLDFSQSFIEHGYKELEIPPAEDGGFRIPSPHSLHIWPCQEFMLIGLPNPDGSFTCTMFAPFKLFDKLDAGGDAAIAAFFDKYFPDAVPLLPDVVGQYKRNPTGALVTMRMKPWNYKDRVVLMGDAAHAIVPFFGQGMNAGFEDTVVFSEILDQENSNLSACVERFAKERRPDGDAIAILSYENYKEMRSHTASSVFRFRKRLEALLHAIMPKTWIPLYSLVAFTRVPYSEALMQSRRQDTILQVAAGITAVAAVGAACYAGKTAYTSWGGSGKLKLW